MKRSKFSLSNYKLLSCDMGSLVPIGLTEVLPGDTIQQATSALVRVSPLVAPVMHPVQVRIHHWFVPNRILWDKWEDFITGGPDGMDISDFPTISLIPQESTLPDYLGVPPSASALEVNALPFRAYAKIWNEWYRDQDLQAELAISKASGLDATTNTTLQNVAWEKDYFTSARPWTQKGPDVTVPIGDRAPVKADVATGLQSSVALSLKNQANTDSQLFVRYPSDSYVAVNQGGATNAPMYVDLSQATGVNINDLREAFALQRYEEARARYGSRYTEYLRYLGVRSSDARLQRPEYLGGGKQTIQFSEVLKTGSGEDPSVPLGTMVGHGIGALRSNRYRKFFEEHGYVLSLMSVKPRTMYTQGLARHWNRRTKEDFFQRELQHIGQQEILNKELYATHTQPDGVFGYQDRYDEYRRTESTVSGEMRSLLDYWHYARIFATEPALNADFIKSVPTKRVNAEQTQHCLYIMANHSIQARRIVAQTGSSFIF